MSEYKKYTNEDIEKAKSVDTLDFLMEKGYSFRRAGNEYKCVEHDSLVVNNDRHRWYWNSRSVGGHSVIDFCTKIEGKTFPEALKEILGYSPNEMVSGNQDTYQKKTIRKNPNHNSHINTKTLRVNLIIKIMKRLFSNQNNWYYPNLNKENSHDYTPIFAKKEEYVQN